MNPSAIKLLVLGHLTVCLITLPKAKATESKQIFEITGNERTDTNYIKKLAQGCMEDRNDLVFEVSPQLDSLKQCLLNSKLFSEVKTSIEGDRIKIGVEEKWTLIPAPFYQSSGETRKAGIVLFETNFLGKGLTLALGATYSNRGNSFFGFFTDPSLYGTRYFTSLSARRESATFELKEDNENTEKLLEKSISGSIILGYNFSWLRLSGQLSRNNRSYEGHEDFTVPEDYCTTQAGLTLEYDRRDYMLYFSEGFYARARYAENLNQDDSAKRLKTANYLLSWQHKIVSDHALYIQTTAAKNVGGRLTDAERVGSTKGFRGIETRTAWAESYQTETLEYQMPIKSFEKGTLTWALFVDEGHIQNRGGNNSDARYTAPGVGVYFYLKRLALPGLGLEYGVNHEYQGTFVNFSLGLSI